MDRSIIYSYGILEDIPIKVGDYFVLGDFIILEMEEDRHIPIILGRPFLATAGAIIDVKRGKILLEIGEEKVEFDVFKKPQQSPSMTSWFRVDVVNVCDEDILPQVPKKPLKTCIILDTKEVKATKKVKKKKRSLAKEVKEWRIKSIVKNMHFKKFSSSFQASSKRAQVGEEYSLIKPL